MLNKRQRDFNKALYTVFNTDSGKRVLAYLKDDYLNVSPVGQTPEMTYYNAGQQDLIRLLIKSVKTPDELDDINIITDVVEDTYE